MTSSHAPEEPAAVPSPPDKRHLRLAQEVRIAPTEAGRFAVPLFLHEGTAEPAVIPLVLTADDAVSLYGTLGLLHPVVEGSVQ
jgi:hypothetical protein